jgi:hypothetical protein
MAFARGLAAAPGTDTPSAETHAASRFATAREEEVAGLRRSLAGPLRDVTGAAFRRSLGRVVAAI